MTHDRSVQRLGRAAVAMAIFGVGSEAAGQTLDLIEAVRREEVRAVDQLLQHQGGRAENAAQADGTTALHWAAHQGNVDIVTRLIRAGADVSAVNRYGVAPIWLAAQNGHAAVVEALLRAGADPNTTRADSGETVLMNAARAGHTSVLDRLIAYGADVNQKERVRGQTALIWAAAERHPAAVTLLVRAGADLGARSNIGMTPLMFAVRAGDIATTAALLDEGADLEARAPDGTTVLSFAIINAHWELAAFLANRGADPNGNDPVHGRPLHVLAMMRRAENRGLSGVLPRRPSGTISSIALAETLLARGARINDRIDWKDPNHAPPHMSLSFFFTISYVGATPLFIASKNCDVEFIKFLIANGADWNIATAQNITPLLAAAGVGHSVGESPETAEEALEAVKLLAALGSDVKAIADFSGPQTADPGARGGSRRSGLDGSSALHGAVIREAPELVKWLIENNAPVGHKNKAGQTALDTVYNTGLGVTRLSRVALADMLREAMIAKGIPVPAKSSN